MGGISPSPKSLAQMRPGGTIEVRLIVDEDPVHSIVEKVSNVAADVSHALLAVCPHCFYGWVPLIVVVVGCAIHDEAPFVAAVIFMRS